MSIKWLFQVGLPLNWVYLVNLSSKFAKKKFFFKKIFFGPVGGSKPKKVVIFAKKPEKHEKPIFFFKNGPIDPKI